MYPEADVVHICATFIQLICILSKMWLVLTILWSAEASCIALLVIKEQTVCSLSDGIFIEERVILYFVWKMYLFMVSFLSALCLLKMDFFSAFYLLIFSIFLSFHFNSLLFPLFSMIFLSSFLFVFVPFPFLYLFFCVFLFYLLLKIILHHHLCLIFFDLAYSKLLPYMISYLTLFKCPFWIFLPSFWFFCRFSPFLLFFLFSFHFCKYPEMFHLINFFSFLQYNFFNWFPLSIYLVGSVLIF